MTVTVVETATAPLTDWAGVDARIDILYKDSMHILDEIDDP